MVIGVDFDNTIACYDSIIATIAREALSIGPNAGDGKKEIRDMIRALPDGERRWMETQAEAYGPRMGEATLKEGARAFFARARELGVKTLIVSHKTEYAKTDVEMKTSLRAAAMKWMEEQGFFSPGGFGLSKKSVFFESTRLDKVERIRREGCTHFIDDLVEVFVEAAFPKGVEKILFTPQPQAAPSSDMVAFSSWKGITDHVFRRIGPI